MIKKQLMMIILSSLLLTACGGDGDNKKILDNNNDPDNSSVDDLTNGSVDDSKIDLTTPPKIAGTKLFSLKLKAGLVKQISTGKTIGINVKNVNSGVLLVAE